MSSISLAVEVPVASFRMSYAREYAESYEVPPPATVYGMLLSLVGETDRHRHVGAYIAIARPSAESCPMPERSVILRTFRRIKKRPIGDLANARPDFQEVLTGVCLAIWVDSGVERGQQPTLVERMRAAFQFPEGVERFGGLSLGESRDLVDSVSLLSEQPPHGGRYSAGTPCVWLRRDEVGPLTMPYWVDHVGSAKTLWASYRLTEGHLAEPDADCWTEIAPGV
jgi:CRISPR-associated protein Cas5t